MLLNGGISVAYLISDELLELAQQKRGLEDPQFYDFKGAIIFGRVTDAQTVHSWIQRGSASPRALKNMV